MSAYQGARPCLDFIFLLPCRVGGEPDLRCGAWAIHRACAELGVENPDLIRTFHRSQDGKLDQEAVERGETEMVPGQGEMERLQPGHQGPEAPGTQELVVSLRLHDQSLIRPWPDLGMAGWVDSPSTPRAAHVGAQVEANRAGHASKPTAKRAKGNKP
jgi:hypothetical protein